MSHSNSQNETPITVTITLSQQQWCDIERITGFGHDRLYQLQAELPEGYEDYHLAEVERLDEGEAASLVEDHLRPHISAPEEIIRTVIPAMRFKVTHLVLVSGHEPASPRIVESPFFLDESEIRPFIESAPEL